MQIENSFTVSAPPDTVFAFLLDVNRVVGCVPGAELSEVVDPETFRGKVRIKVGPVTVAYNGTAHITARDEQTRSATLNAEGRETTGSGSARATTTMTVTPEGTGSTVRIATDFTVVGRVAQFGRGIMEEVSRKLVGQMADCIRAKLEAEAAAGATHVAAAPPPVNGGAPAREASPRTRRPRASAAAAKAELAPEDAPAAPAAPAVTAPAPLAETAPVAAAAPPPPTRVQLAVEPEQAPAAAPVDALALARSVAADRLRAAGPGRLMGVAVALFSVFALVRLLRNRRSRSD